MKELIVIIGTVMLGAVVFEMMVGEGEDTLRGVSEQAMRKTVETYNEYMLEREAEIGRAHV